jgi:Carboxypeptidase regulatory-like domain
VRPLSRVAIVGVMSFVASGSSLAQQTRLALTGTVTSDGDPVVGALVTLDPADLLRAVRSDSAGHFHLDGVTTGRHTVLVTALGFTAVQLTIEVAGNASPLHIILQPRQSLAAVNVVGRRTGIYGIVADAENFSAIAGAVVEVIGSRQTATTDSGGRFNLPTVKPGSYLVRIGHQSYAERAVPVVVPKDSAFEFGVTLSPSVRAADAKLDRLWKEADSRIHEAGLRSVFVPAREFGDNPRRGVDMALALSRTIMSKGLRVAGANVAGGIQENRPDKEAAEPCVFLEGRPMPGWKLSMFSAGEIEAVEAYGYKSRQADMLARMWPLGGPECGVIRRLEFRAPLERGQINGEIHADVGVSAQDRELVQFVVIWLKR